jgi:hypothetical protein
MKVKIAVTSDITHAGALGEALIFPVTLFLVITFAHEIVALTGQTSKSDQGGGLESGLCDSKLVTRLKMTTTAWG